MDNAQKSSQKILALLKENPQITRRELAELVGISQNDIKYRLDTLKEQGRIKRIGPDKGRYWEIV